MQLDRNIPGNHGRGKYALLLLRDLGEPALPKFSQDVYDAIRLLDKNGLIDCGESPDKEFFVIRLKDKFAPAALHAYACAASREDPQYAEEIFELCLKAENHPNKRKPD